MQQNDALFQIKLLNVSVYLVSVCSVAEQTLSVCIKLLAMRGSMILGPLTRAVLMRLNFSFFFYKRNYAFWCILHASWFPMQWAEQLLCHLECERIPGQLLEVGHLSRWMDWLLRVEVGERKADGPTEFCQSSLSIVCVTGNTAGWASCLLIQLGAP